MNAPTIPLTHLGTDSGRGNLLGVQPFLTTPDYTSAETFRAALEPYLNNARDAGCLGPRTIAVFPEYIGTFLAAAGHGAPVRNAPTLNAAMRRVAVNYGLAYVGQLLRSHEPDRATAALFRSQADRMAMACQVAFSGLARDYAVTIVAGSIILPNPHIEGGRLRAGTGPLYNTSVVYGPDGLAHPSLVRKVYPTSDEQPHLTAAPVAELPVFDTPAGRLGVLVCADAWYPPAYDHLNRHGVDLLAVPAFVSKQGLWDQPWGGYNGGSMPADVNPADVGALTEAQAWRKYALAGRLPESGARAGLVAYLRGQFWELTADGGTSLARSGDQVTEASGQGGALLNLWL
jgi:predicted amidohydrolase